MAGFELTLRRKVSHYIITYYLPSGMFVIVSWISFLVPPDIVPGRMTLLVTVFLVLVNIFNTITTNIPKESAYVIETGHFDVVINAIHVHELPSLLDFTCKRKKFPLLTTEEFLSFREHLLYVTPIVCTAQYVGTLHRDYCMVSPPTHAVAYELV